MEGEEEEGNGVVAHQINILFHGQLHKKSLISFFSFFLTLSMCGRRWRRERVVVKVRGRQELETARERKRSSGTAFSLF